MAGAEATANREADRGQMAVYAMIPTYNEAENIVPLINDILSRDPERMRVVVVDDDSPDGTAGLVRDFAARDARVHLLLRTKRRGRGSAGIDGFAWCLDREDAEMVVEMDADFSHQPKYIPDLIQAAQQADVVLGSRFVSGGSDADRGPLRRLITQLAGIYTRRMLGITVRDTSSGFRLFHRRVLEAIDLDNMLSHGPSIVAEVLFKSIRKGFSVAETPIAFIDRTRGSTKLDYVTLLEVLVMILRLRQMARAGRV